jgi:DNA-directed RNA polymerase subunit RPC12/RpoP
VTEFDAVAGIEVAHAHYDFLCQACKRLFSKTLTLPQYEEAETRCPYCDSDDLEQGRWVILPLPRFRRRLETL